MDRAVEGDGRSDVDAPEDLAGSAIDAEQVPIAGAVGQKGWAGLEVELPHGFASEAPRCRSKVGCNALFAVSANVPSAMTRRSVLSATSAFIRCAFTVIDKASPGRHNCIAPSRRSIDAPKRFGRWETDSSQGSKTMVMSKPSPCSDADSGRPLAVRRVTSVDAVDEGDTMGFLGARGAVRGIEPAESVIRRIRDASYPTAGLL